MIYRYSMKMVAHGGTESTEEKRRKGGLAHGGTESTEKMGEWGGNRGVRKKRGESELFA